MNDHSLNHYSKIRHFIQLNEQFLFAIPTPSLCYYSNERSRVPRLLAQLKEMYHKSMDVVPENVIPPNTLNCSVLQNLPFFYFSVTFTFLMLLTVNNRTHLAYCASLRQVRKCVRLTSVHCTGSPSTTYGSISLYCDKIMSKKCTGQTQY